MPPIVPLEFSWRNHDNSHIFGRSWQPAAAIKGVVCLVHGLGEHGGRYRHLAERLSGAGYALLSCDLPGHGRSTGRRGHVSRFETFFETIDRLLQLAAEQFPDRPRFLYGHSMGGNLTLTFVLRRRPELAGVIVTAPWLQLTSPPPAFQLKLIQWIGRFWPGLSFSNRLDPTTLSRDPAVVSAYVNDPLVHDRLSARLLTDIEQHGRWTLAHASDFPLPLLLIHGAADRLTSPEASRRFAAQLPAGCTFKLWPELFHEPHNEPEQREVFDFISGWLDHETEFGKSGD